MGPFFGRGAERTLKGSFICGSDSNAENPGVNRLRTPDSAGCRTQAPRPWPFVLRAGLVLLLWGGWALPGAWAGEGQDHEQARAAVRAGQVLPLTTLLERLQRAHPGKVLEIELEHDDGRWVYEVKLLQPDGQLLKIDIDAGTGQVLPGKRKEGRRSESPQGRQPAPSKEASR
jgi:hypothetical protein